MEVKDSIIAVFGYLKIIIIKKYEISRNFADDYFIIFINFK